MNSLERHVVPLTPNGDTQSRDPFAANILRASLFHACAIEMLSYGAATDHQIHRLIRTTPTYTITPLVVLSTQSPISPRSIHACSISDPPRTFDARTSQTHMRTTTPDCRCSFPSSG